jgi:hypothetical protein
MRERQRDYARPIKRTSEARKSALSNSRWFQRRADFAPRGFARILGRPGELASSDFFFAQSHLREWRISIS